MCYDSQKWTILSLVPVAVTLIVGLVILVGDAYGLPLEGKEHPSLIFNDGTLAVLMDGSSEDPLPVISMLVKQGYTIDAISNEDGGEYTFTYMTKGVNKTKWIQ